jgi:hypothetical protein
VEQQFRDRADGICRQMIMQIEQSRLAKPTVAELARVTPSHVKFEQQGIRVLSRLQPPSTLARDWRQMLDYMSTLARELASLGRSAKARDQGAIKVLARSKKRVHALLTALAQHDGFTECQLK